jgi:hypothetical protein
MVYGVGAGFPRPFDHFGRGDLAPTRNGLSDYFVKFHYHAQF